MKDSNPLKPLAIAKEEAYFKKQNDEAIKRIQERSKNNLERLSPITKEALVECTIHGIVVDMCKKSGGVWLDAGELEQIISNVENDTSTEDISYAKSFILALKQASS